MPVVIITLNEEINDIIAGIKLGVHGYLQATIFPEELKEAITALTTGNVYYFDLAGERVIYSEENDIRDPRRLSAAKNLPEPQQNVFKLLCSSLSYEEIAAELQISPRTLSGYRKDIYSAIRFKSRVGLVLFAIRNNLFDQDDKLRSNQMILKNV